jgi:antitoxin (DNA-binding transcriptional repressor) of toxin-antitoxin stability system
MSRIAVLDTSVKHVTLLPVKTITIRDLRQRWPEAEAALKAEDEILVTRDGKPVARLLPVCDVEANRPRWNPEAHKRWLAKAWKNRTVSLVDKYLLSDREGRKPQVS